MGVLYHEKPQRYLCVSNDEQKLKQQHLRMYQSYQYVQRVLGCLDGGGKTQERVQVKESPSKYNWQRLSLTENSGKTEPKLRELKKLNSRAVCDVI